MSVKLTGSSNYDFEPMHQRMQWYIDQELLSCCYSLVLHGSDVVDYKCFGYMDIESKTPLREDAIYRMYSNTKLCTSIALMILYERNKFDLDDPLEKYLPEFGDMQVLKPDATKLTDTVACETSMTPRQLLSHSAGLSYGFVEPDSVIDQGYLSGGLNIMAGFDETLAEVSARLGNFPLAYQPGTQWRYSLATDVCARLVEVLSGVPFDQFLEAEIFAPLRMVDTSFHVPPEKQDRFTTMYSGVDPLDPMKPGLVKVDDPHTGTYSAPKQFLSGGGGLVSTVADYVAFIQMIINGGEWGGTRIIDSDTLNMMRTNQLAEGLGVNFPMWAMPNTLFGLGFALREQPAPEDKGDSCDEYFWGGMAGTHSWMAPRAGIAGLCLTQLMPGFWHPFSHEFRQFAYASAP